MNIKYVGRHARWTDNIFGTGLTWLKGETVHPIIPPIAKRMLKWGSVFQQVAGVSSPAPLPSAPEYDPTQDAHDLINRMGDIEAVAAYAFTYFGGHQIDRTMDLGAAKAQARMLFDMYLAPIPESTVKPVKADTLAVGQTAADPSSLPEPPDQPDDIESQIVALHSQHPGMKPSEIGRLFGIHHNKVLSILKRHE